MKDEKIKNKVMSGLIWKFAERISAQGISFIVSIVLARLLSPEEYGLVAIILVFINLANVFITSGFGDALIQKKDSEEKDFSTAFICSLGFSIIVYGIMFFTAPFIADFYHNQDLIPLIRVLSIQIPLGSLKTIQHAYVSKHMQFKKFFFSTIGGTLASGCIGITLAFNGFGVWALIFQYLTNSVIDMLVLMFTVPWRPTLFFNTEIAKVLFNYGWKITGAKFINALYNNLRSLLIGSFYSPSDLALYNKGDHFPQLFINNVNTSISSVLFPALSRHNDDLCQLKKMTRRSMKISSYVIFPLMIGLMAIGHNLIEVLLTDKWLGCVPFLWTGCVFWMFQPIQTANAEAIKALGKSDTYLKLELIKKPVSVALILISVRFGVTAIALSNVLVALFSMLINIYPNRKMLGYGYREQFKDIFSAAILSVIMGICVALVGVVLPVASKIVVLIFQVIVGVVTYVFLSYIFKVDSFIFITNLIKKKMNRRNTRK